MLTMGDETVLGGELLDRISRDLFDFVPIPCLELDLSELRKAVDRLRTERVADWRQHFRARPDEVAELARLTRVVRANREFLKTFDLQRLEDVSAFVARVFSKKCPYWLADAIAALTAGKMQIDLESHRVAGRGKSREFIPWVGVLPGSEATWDVIVMAFRDVTQQKMDERKVASLRLQLRHASRLATLGELAATIAHEVNQPLCSIANFAAACRNTCKQPAPPLEKIVEWTESIGAAAHRAGEIVRRYSTFASTLR